MTEVAYQWPPLESDPGIFNKYFQEIGLPEYIGFEELLSLDTNTVENQFADFPIFGVMAAISRPKGRYFIEENLCNWDSAPFYMRQTRELDLACGLIAALHLFGNNLECIEFPENSLLKTYFDETQKVDHEQRAKVLEENKDFKQKHFIYAHQGQSNLPTEESSSDSDEPEQKKVIKSPVVHHFVSFLIINNNLVEMDGTLWGPHIIKKDVSRENLMIETLKELKYRIELGVIGEDLSVQFLTYR